MTIDEFKAVMSIGDTKVVVWKNSWLTATAPRKYTAGLIMDCDPITNDINPLNLVIQEFSGHTEKAALKKLKDWWYYEGRKNGNN